jgi:hypothetical protein
MNKPIGRPLLISDCDEVLLHMVVPFANWLDEAHAITFEMTHGDWGKALRYKADDSLVDGALIWQHLNQFFDEEMHRQMPINGAVDAITRLSDIADVVILTNLLDHRAGPRGDQLRGHGIDVPVYTNQGGKGEALNRILAEYQPSVAVFVDDLPQQHDSVAEHAPQVWRLHLVGEPLITGIHKAPDTAHARIDVWPQAEDWIRDKLLNGVAAPVLEKKTT